MDIRDRRGLKAAARESLAAASYDPGKLILIHTGAMAALSLLIALLGYLLDRQIGGTGGLGGLGLRSVLETAQTVLSYGQIVVMLFWRMGYVYVTLQLSRRRAVGPGSLLEGFRNFLPVLRLQLMLALQSLGIVLLCVYLASAVFSFTPWAAPLMEAYEVGTEEELLAAMEACMPPVMGLTVVAMLIVAVPYLYRLLLAELSLMDDPSLGARRAIRRSREMMQGNRRSLLMLDLSFWWFYLLELLISVLSYGDLLLMIFGVELPWSDTVNYYLFVVIAYVLQLALYRWRGNELQVTYAKFYEALLPNEEPR